MPLIFSLLVALISTAFSVNAQNNAARSPVTKPTDAASYCEKVMNSEVATRVTAKYALIRSKLNDVFALSGKNPNDPALRNFLSQTHQAFILGFDDDARSKTRLLVKKLNDAVPKKDAYNQDATILQYIPWFASCASKLKDSPLKFIFLDPSDNRALAAFYGAESSTRNAKLQEIWDVPNLGGLYDRRIQEKTGLANIGINPRWVTPMLFLSDDSALKVEPSQSDARLDPILKQLDVHIASTKADMRSFANDNKQSPPLANDQQTPPTSGQVSNFQEYCQRLTSNSDVQKLLSGLNAIGPESVLLDHTYLDNKNRDLEKWVAQKIANLKTPNEGRICMECIEDYRKRLGWINMCLIQQRKTPLFLLAFARYNIPQGQSDWYETHLEKANLAAAALSAPATQASGRTSSSQMESKFEAINPSEKYEDLKRSGSAHPREATLLAFLFPGAEEMVKKTSSNAVTAQQLYDAEKERQAQIAAAAAAKEDAQYEPLRKLIKFSRNKDIAPAFQVCIKNESVYFDGLMRQLEPIIKNAATIKEQQEMKERVSSWQQMKPTGIEAFCLYRLNIAILVAESGAEAVRRVSEMNLFVTKAILGDSSDLDAKYTAVAIEKIQKHLKISPEAVRKERGVDPDYAFISPLILEQFVAPIRSGKAKL